MIPERIHVYLDNLVRVYSIKCTYIDDDEPWLGILVEAEFAVCSTTNTLKVYIIGELVSVHDMIIPIQHTADWN